MLYIGAVNDYNRNLFPFLLGGIWSTVCFTYSNFRLIHF